MTVKQIMNKRVVMVELDDRLSTVKEIFDNVKFHHLLVVESDRLLGVLSDRDLLKALSPNIGKMTETEDDLATLNKRVHHIMSRNPVVLHSDAEINDAIDLFNTHTISCIPVVDDEYRPIGIISWRDIIKAIGASRKKRPDKKSILPATIS